MRFEDYKPANEQAKPDAAVASLALVRDPVDARIFRPDGKRNVIGLATSGVSWLIAIAAHAALVGGLSLAFDDERAGAAGDTFEAQGIEVAIVSAQALEAQRIGPAELPTASTAIDEKEGETEQDAAKPTQPEQTAAADPEPVIIAKPDPSPTPSETEIVVAETKPPEPRKEPEKEDKKDKTEEPPVATPTPPMETGSVAVTAVETTSQVARQAAVAASPGVVNRYARSIAEALAKSRPKLSGTQAKGTVKVAFAIAEDGRTEFVRIAASSGNKRLDEVALAAISTVAFPPPPPGMTLGQRTYEIPYFFR